MDMIYFDIPSDSVLYELLSRRLKLSDSFRDAKIVVTYGGENVPADKFVIQIGKKRRRRNSVVIDGSLEPEEIARTIISVIDTINICSSSDQGSPRDYSAAKLYSILNASPEAIAEFDSKGTIGFFNTKFSDICAQEITPDKSSIFKVFDSGTAEIIDKGIRALPIGGSFEFEGGVKRKDGAFINVAGHISDISGAESAYEIMFEDISEKLKKAAQIRKTEEQAIVAGFSRHLSHNVMNALTTAGGFIRQIKAKTSSDLYNQNIWHIIDGKLMFIEEIVAAYNDYTHALSLNPSETDDIGSYFNELFASIASKDFDNKFSAYLNKFTENYNMTCDFSESGKFEIKSNVLYLKLAICYILKDNIRYFGGGTPLDFKVKLKSDGSNFYIYLDMENIFVPDFISDTMFKPWNHQMQAQSFDYWGVMVATTIIERHNGRIFLDKYDNGSRFLIVFLQPPF